MNSNKRNAREPVQAAQIFVHNPCFYNFTKHHPVLIPAFKPYGKILCNYHEIRVSLKKHYLSLK